jgi:hypothetical protein
MTLFMLDSPEIKYSAVRKKSGLFSANGSRRGSKTRFRYGFLSFIGKTADFLSLAERGGFEPPVGVLAPTTV